MSLSKLVQFRRTLGVTDDLVERYIIPSLQKPRSYLAGELEFFLSLYERFL
jgi:hypothetical protein